MAGMTRRTAYADALMLTGRHGSRASVRPGETAGALFLLGGTLFALDLVLALATQFGLADVATVWLGALALGASSLAFVSMWVARYRATAPPRPPVSREPASG